MKRHLTGILAASLVALVVGACGDDQAYCGGGGPQVDPCASYGSCGDCTPVPGCGWCFSEGRAGVCSSDPDTCQPATSWTWNPSGCTVIAHPTVSEDASTPLPVVGGDASTQLP